MRSLLVQTAFLVASAAALPAMAGPQIYGGNGGYYGGVVRCESSDGRTRECALDTSGGVQLVRQLSNAACIEGRTWGLGRNGVWVSQGCRGEFRAMGGGYSGGQGSPYGYGNGNGAYGNGGAYGGGYGNGNNYGGGYGSGNGNGNAYGQGQVVRCESNDGRTQRCPLYANARGVQLVRQLSRTACVEGRTWGYDRGGIWVSQGCRGDFIAAGSGNRYGGGADNGGYGTDRYDDGYGNGGYNGGHNGRYGGYGQVFRCESNDGRTHECAANTRAGVQLVRQLSNAACIQGQTWGYGRNGIWVSQGCRAEFRSF